MRFRPACIFAISFLLPAQPLTFEVASIKPSSPGGPPGVGRLRMTPGRVFGRGVTARRIIQDAYHLSDYQFPGGPAWLDRDTFDLDAKSTAPATTSELRQMLQKLLADRFKLVAHRTPKEMAVYFLAVAKGDRN